jgi:predicted transcriptional regulator
MTLWFGDTKAIPTPSRIKGEGNTLNILQVIEDAAIKIAPGKAPYFIEAHIVKVLMIVNRKPVGRVSLAKALGLGEGSIRTLVKHLEKAGLIGTSREGIVLTRSGQELVSNMKSRVSETIEVPKSVLTVGAFNVAVLVRGVAESVKAGLEQRDAAIKVGAHGATTLIFNNGRLSMPLTNEDVFRGLPKVRDMIISRLTPKENDIVVIGSAGDKLTAELGAIAAALETLKTR